MRPIQHPNRPIARRIRQIRCQAQVVDAEVDAGYPRGGITEGDDIGGTEVADEGKVAGIVGVGFEGFGLVRAFAFFGDGSALLKRQTDQHGCTGSMIASYSR